MKRSLIFITVIVLFVGVSFGQKNKKTNQNPSSAPAGAEQQKTGTTQQRTTQKAQSQTDFNHWYSAKAYNWDAVAKLNSSNNYVDDNTFRLTKQYASESLGRLICYVNHVNPCNGSGEIESKQSGDMRGVSEALKDAKTTLQKAAGTAERDQIIALIDRAILEANNYIAAHPPESDTKNKSTDSQSNGSSNLTRPDETTKTKVNSNNSNSSGQNSTQKTTKPNSGFMDYTDDAVKSAPKSTKKQTNNLGGDDDLEKTQRSTKTKNSKIKAPQSGVKKTNTVTKQDAGYRDTDEDVEDVKAKSKTTQPKTSNLSGDDDLEKTQRSAKTNNSNAKTSGSASVAPKKNAKKNTNFQTTSEDLQSVKKAKTQNGVNDPGDWSSEAKTKTTPKSSNTTSRKRKVSGIHEGNELKIPKKKP